MGTCLGLLLDAGCASRPKRDPEQSQIRYRIAAGNFREQRIEAAIEELQKALQADPENADAYNMLGIIALRQGHDYVVQLESASCLKGKDAELVRGEAQAKFNEAIKNLRKAVELRPEFPEAWNNLSVAEFQLQSWDAAIEAAQNALKGRLRHTGDGAREPWVGLLPEKGYPERVERAARGREPCTWVLRGPLPACQDLRGPRRNRPSSGRAGSGDR